MDKNQIERAVCKTECGGVFGTGFLVSDHLILTAFHNIEKYKENNILICFYRNSNPNKLPDKILVNPIIINEEDNKRFDIVLLELNKPIKDISYLKLMYNDIPHDIQWNSFGYPSFNVSSNFNGTHVKGTVNSMISSYNILNWDVELDYDGKDDILNGLSGAPLIISDFVNGIIVVQNRTKIGAISFKNIDKIMKDRVPIVKNTFLEDPDELKDENQISLEAKQFLIKIFSNGSEEKKFNEFCKFLEINLKFDTTNMPDIITKIIKKIENNPNPQEILFKALIKIENKFKDQIDKLFNRNYKIENINHNTRYIENDTNINLFFYYHESSKNHVINLEKLILNQMNKVTIKLYDDYIKTQNEKISKVLNNLKNKFHYIFFYIDDKFLKSDKCLYDVLCDIGIKCLLAKKKIENYEEANFFKQICFIISDNLKIETPEDRNEYIKFWEFRFNTYKYDIIKKNIDFSKMKVINKYIDGFINLIHQKPILKYSTLKQSDLQDLFYFLTRSDGE